jgi:hypothetical protein
MALEPRERGSRVVANVIKIVAMTSGMAAVASVGTYLFDLITR